MSVGGRCSASLSVAVLAGHAALAPSVSGCGLHGIQEVRGSRRLVPAGRNCEWTHRAVHPARTAFSGLMLKADSAWKSGGVVARARRTMDGENGRLVPSVQVTG